MDDDIAGVDQHPIALGHAFDAGAAKAFVFQLFGMWSATAPTCRCERPEATTIWSPIEVLPLKSMIATCSALEAIERVEHDFEETIRMRAK